MSEYTPTRGEILSALVAYRVTPGNQTPAEIVKSKPVGEVANLLAEAERGLAEVERAAAEKALRKAANDAQAGVFPTGVDLSGKRYGPLHTSVRDWLNGFADTYRRNEGAQNAVD